MKVEELVERSYSLLKDIEDYIKSVPGWIYYWIPINMKSDSKNYQIKQFVIENQDDWEDMAELKVENFNGISVQVKITIDFECEEITFTRYAILTHFERDVKYNKMGMDGELNDFKIQDLKDEIKYHNEQIKLAEEELSKLTKDGK